MTKECLDKSWCISSYEEDSPEHLDYYLNENACGAGDVAYLYSCENDTLSEMKIVHVVKRSSDPELYDELIKNPNVLVEGEDTYGADTSAEFITDDNSYLVWFKYVY